MGEITTNHYLVLATVLFFIGTLGVLGRRGALTVLMSIELMLNAVNLVLIAGSRQWGNLDGQMVAFFVIAIAAAEAAVGLAIVLGFFRVLRTVETDQADQLKH